MKVTPEILKKYTLNECSETERNLVEAWIQTSDYEEDSSSVPVSDFLEEKLWNNIKSATVPPKKKNVVEFKKQFYWVAAACVVLLVGLGFYNEFINSNKIITYVTLPGEKQTITLNDGTKVYLNANSVFTAPKHFTGGLRKVTLKGEAYFDVSKDSMHDFIINTHTSQTRILGTKFNLSAYNQEPVVLTLDEGRVSFKSTIHTGHGLILFPGEQGIITGGHIVKAKVNTKHYTGWLANTFFFNEEKFSNIIRKTERAYGITVQVKDPQLLNTAYTGVFKNLPLKTLLDDLSFVLKFKYQIKDDKVIIY